MSDLEKVRSFLREKRPGYEALIDEIRHVADDIKKEVGSGIILRVYSRSEKQAGEELKEATKIADAIEGPVTSSKLRDLDDVIGLTIVVQYPDQIGPVAKRMTDALKGRQIRENGGRDHTGAYYARHDVYRSARTKHQGLRCEVQCKSLLHDAWAAKMHDLTYKPQGAMDGRLKGLVEAISMTLEGLEQQSQIVRDMIVARQNVERRPFQVSLSLLHDELVKGLRSGLTGRRALKGLDALWADVDAARVAGGGLVDSQFEELAARIIDAAAEAARLRVCWLLAVRLVAVQVLPERLALLTNLADTMMEEMATLLADKLFTQRELWAFPVGFYVVQDFGRAIEYADDLLGRADELCLTARSRWALTFNKATWLLERESLRRSKEAVARKVEAQVGALLAELQSDPSFSKNGELVDTEGLLLIVFGKTKEEVRTGIEICAQAASLAGSQDRDVATAYADWRTLVGWRRYFEIAEGSA